MNDHTWRGILDALVEIRENADRQAAAIAEEAGFYRKRACDLDLGDEVVSQGTWALVTGVEQVTLAEGLGFCHVEVEQGGDIGTIDYDPLWLLDVKATYVEEPF